MLQYTQNTVNIWFPNQQEPVHDPSDERAMRKFRAYWNKEIERLKYGFQLGNVFVSGWLYWHTVYWKIATYVEDPRSGRKVRIVITPILRDIEWFIADDLTRCENDGKFYMLIGARDFGKSVIAASRAGWLYTLFDKSESLISSGEYTFIKLVTDKIEDGLINIHPIFRKQRVVNDWKKEIVAGWKDKSTNIISDKSSLSSIKIRNYEMGSKTMAAQGTRPGFHLIDEVGAFPNVISCFKDSEGAWWSGDGESSKPSCLAMLAGTGGDMEIGAEAAEIFRNPDSYNILSFEDTYEGLGRIGRFVSALKAKMSFKEEMSLNQYLEINNPETEHVKIRVANEERAYKEWWEPTYQKALKSGNQKTILKFKAYQPLTPTDSFLVLTKNDFNTDAARAQQARLRGLEQTGTYVWLRHDGEKIVHDFTDKIPITQFPIKDQNTDAPVVIWEFPIQEVPPFGLYTAGVDPYRQESSEYSESLGAVYIFKRTHDIAGEKYQNMLVASYVARPNSKEVWNEQARMLIKYYNAYALVENDEYSFIDYMIKKGDAALHLARQPSWLKEVSPGTRINRDYGISRASERVRRHLNGLFKKYLDDPILKEKDENGSVIKEVLGITKVFDMMLLEEIIKFNFDEGNFDRLVAAELAVAMADHLDAQFVVSDTEGDPRLKAYFSNRRSASRSVIDMYQRTTTTHRAGRSKLFI